MCLTLQQMMFWIEDNFDGDKSSVECTFYSMGGATSAEIQAKYAEMKGGEK